VTGWRLPARVIEGSRDEMARDGDEGNEGTALWLGNREAGVTTIRSVVLLRGPGIVKRPDFISISSDLINEVTGIAIAKSQVLVGQIHSHAFAWTDLSPIDEAGGFRVPGFLSVVAPHFARRPEFDLRSCGVHVFDGRWRRLSIAAQAASIEVLPTGIAEILTVHL
jgi:hypothetical protein